MLLLNVLLITFFFILASTPDEDETPYKRRRSDTMEYQANENGEQILLPMLQIFSQVLR